VQRLENQNRRDAKKPFQKSESHSSKLLAEIEASEYVSLGALIGLIEAKTASWRVAVLDRDRNKVQRFIRSGMGGLLVRKLRTQQERDAFQQHIEQVADYIAYDCCSCAAIPGSPCVTQGCFTGSFYFDEFDDSCPCGRSGSGPDGTSA